MHPAMIAAVIALVLAAGLLALWWYQERILFQPPHKYGEPIKDGRIDYAAADGQSLTGYVVGDPRTARGVVLCFHGNADLAMWQIEWAQEIYSRAGYFVFLAEYRGYMSLGGSPTYATTKLDALAAYDFVSSSFGYAVSRMAYFGHSLGSAVAAELAETHPPRVLLLQSPFSSARDMARIIVTGPIALLWRLVSRIHFDTVAVVSHLDVPTAVSHGKRDRIVPFKMGLEVYEAAKIKGPLLIVDGAGHSDMVAVAGDDYWKWIAAALGS
ncbi:MAG: alpha/beta hydrolase [Gemmatimonadaceae bacterium]